MNAAAHLVMEGEDMETRKPLWIEILQWIAVLPGAVLGAWVVYIIVGIIHLISADPDDWSWWNLTTREVFRNVGMGGAFVYLAVCIAPRFKVQVAFVFAGIVLFLSGAFLFAALQVQHYISIVSNISLNTGAIIILIKTLRAKGVPEIDGPKAERIREEVLDYREVSKKAIEAENTLLSAFRQEFGEGYGPSGMLVCTYSDILGKATIENSRSRKEEELPSSREEIKQGIIEIAKLAIKGPEDNSTRELLKIIYISLSRFLPESQAGLVTERNLGWLSEDPNHPGLRRSKEAEQVEAEVAAEEDRLAQEFDRIALELLKDEVAKTKSELTKARMKLLELLHELSPDDPHFVENILVEASSKSDLGEGTPDRYLRDGVFAWTRGDHETALDLFTRCIDLDPDEGMAFLNRGNLQLEMGSFEDGIADLERARDIDPELPWQNALVFKMLEPEERERTRQAMLKESQKKKPNQRS